MKVTITFSEPPAARCFTEVLAGLTRAYRSVTIEHMDGLSLELETGPQRLGGTRPSPPDLGEADGEDPKEER